MKYIKPIIHFNLRIIIVVLLLGVSFIFTSCAALTDMLMEDATDLNDYKSIEEDEQTETPLSGGVITVAMPTELRSFNPLKEKNINMYNLYTLIFESPLKLNVDGTFSPELIENWVVDDSGMVWTFYLRKDIQWHNGFGELTADDLVFTLDIITDMETDESDYSRYNRRIGEYYALDKYTFVLNAVDPLYDEGDEEDTPDPSSYIEHMMTFPVLCEAYYQNERNLDTYWPLGTGPYEFSDYEISEGIVLDVNDHWWKTKPYITTIKAIPIPDAASEIKAYEEQRLDLVGTSDLSANRYRKYGVTNVDEYMTQYYDCLLPNLYLPSTGETKFIHSIKGRQAVAYALDKSQIISKVLVNHAVATDVPIPPDSWLYDSSLTIYEHNQNEAIRLLEEMGYTEFDEDGFRARMNNETGELDTLVIELLYPKEIQSAYKQNVASLIEEQLEEVGIRVDLIEKSESIFETRVKAGAFDLALVSFYIDRNPDLKFMLHSSRFTCNYGHYRNEFMDNAIEACGRALTADEKLEAYSDVQEIFVQQLPQISLYFRTNSLIYDDSIHGISDFRSLNIFNDIQNWYVISEVQ